jgi:hypothetical protein
MRGLRVQRGKTGPCFGRMGAIGFAIIRQESFRNARRPDPWYVRNKRGVALKR